MNEDYLSHHGILGQKWGVRRYQNKDGSLTEAGQARYAKSLSRYNRYAKNLNETEVTSPLKRELAKRLNSKYEEISELDKDIRAPIVYEYENFWKDRKLAEKYCSKKIDDDVKAGYYSDLSDDERKRAISRMYNYGDGAEGVFEKYLSDNPKAEKEYQQLVSNRMTASSKKRDIITDICNEILGSNGTTKTNMTMLSAQTGKLIDKNGKTQTYNYVAARNVTLNDILAKEANKQLRNL